jgi:hypothetical protein
MIFIKIKKIFKIQFNIYEWNLKKENSKKLLYLL